MVSPAEDLLLPWEITRLKYLLQSIGETTGDVRVWVARANMAAEMLEGAGDVQPILESPLLLNPDFNPPLSGGGGATAHSDLTGVTADQHHAQAHSISGADHSGALGHSSLSGVTADQHHTEAHAIDGAAHSGTLAHTALSGVTADQHHMQAHAIGGADHTGTLDHASLSGVTAGQHHAEVHALDSHTGVIGASSIANRGRTLGLIPVYASLNGVASVLPWFQDAHGSIPAKPHLHLVNGEVDIIYFIVDRGKLPTDWVSGMSLNLMWAATVAGNSWRIRRIGYAHGDGDTAGTTLQDTISTAGAPAAADTMALVEFAMTTNAPTVGDSLSFEFRRIGNDGADSNTGILLLYDHWVEYTADS